MFKSLFPKFNSQSPSEGIVLVTEFGWIFLLSSFVKSAEWQFLKRQTKDTYLTIFMFLTICKIFEMYRSSIRQQEYNPQDDVLVFDLLIIFPEFERLSLCYERSCMLHGLRMGVYQWNIKLIRIPKSSLDYCH